MTRYQAVPSNEIAQNTYVRGFTLIELSVVVVIVAMFLTLGLAALSSQLTSASYAETKKRQTLIKDALTAYLGANKRFPCLLSPTIQTEPPALPL